MLDERTARDMIPFCKRLGATGVFTYPIQVSGGARGLWQCTGIAIAVFTYPIQVRGKG